ncbi:GrpB family protein [Paenibacillus sp. SC116]
MRCLYRCIPKPIIDILVVANDITEIDKSNEQMTKAGYRMPIKLEKKPL